MTLPVFSLSSLPALSQVAGQALRSSAAAGGQFLEMLSSLGDSTTDAAKAEGAESVASPSSTPNLLEQRTLSWSQKLWSWLQEQGLGSASAESRPEMSIEFSLDQFDQPRVAISGASAPEAAEALARDPTWLQEFRELALDRANALGHFVANPAWPMTLTLSSPSETATPQVVWK